MAAQQPIQIHIPPVLRHLSVSLNEFLSTHPQYTNIGVGSFIFAHNRLLLVQRAASEPRFSNLWEVPGGGAELGDPTILHSVARETFEETGLRLTRFVRQVGDEVEFKTRKGLCLKLSFEIEVAEIVGAKIAEVGDHQTTQSEKNGKEASGVEISLDPEEHQNHAWATEEEIESGRYPITTPGQPKLLLESFAIRRAESERLKAAVDGGPIRSSK